MVALVKDDEVRQFVDAQDDFDLTPFIELADLIVTEDLANSGLTPARKKQIELLLAAHYAIVVIERGGLKGTKTGDSSDFYNAIKGEGLKSTRYGLQALALDKSGILADLATPGKRAQFRVV